MESEPEKPGATRGQVPTNDVDGARGARNGNDRNTRGEVQLDVARLKALAPRHDAMAARQRYFVVKASGGGAERSAGRDSAVSGFHP